ncbi:uncharacterized protein M421DRAFT_5923 [Didymella exigua CBS 183.55]|uniref:DUF7580 domain-containing protein n=1 Tax=Didymella exigua CBS 183.55 TaxID=1150837 RepID=A0A6A5RK63_9PLEO|nr:uncharacterized protein M421DRAFT_5923 [Didymella exigua CBS 183.55]KAF1927650.1 hypothetical protein M421DRAFT_5923 [Didymella exigua CBS 183.55]
MADPTTRPEVDVLLRNRLREEGYDVYFANPQLTEPSQLKQEYRRFKFSISKSTYDDQIRKLKRYNNSLTQLTETSLTLEPSRRRATKSFRAIQYHVANLRMENRVKTQRTEKDTTSCAPFHFIFTQAVDASTNSLPSWKEAEIRYVPNALEERPQAPKALRANECSSKKKRSVRFGSIEVQLSRLPDTAAKNTAIAQSATAVKPDSKLCKIQNLCVAIAQLSPEHDICVGFLLDTSQQKHGVYSLTTDHIRQDWASYTLDEVLTGPQSHLAPISMRDKLRLNEDWKQTEVLFVKRPGLPASSVYEHPYVCCDLSQSAAQQTVTAPTATYRVIRNKALYNLGIVLIELCYGKPMRGLEEPEDLQCDGTPGVEWCIANRIVKTKQTESVLGWRYSDAIRHCIWCDFGIFDADPDNEEFQSAVHEGVVEQLEESLRYWEGQP